MTELEKKLFDMYKNAINNRQCKQCRTIAKNKAASLNPPISFWYFGNNFADKNKPNIVFIGKTTWMAPKDFQELTKIGPIYDGRPDISYFLSARARC